MSRAAGAHANRAPAYRVRFQEHSGVSDPHGFVGHPVRVVRPELHGRWIVDLVPALSLAMDQVQRDLLVEPHSRNG